MPEKNIKRNMYVFMLLYLSFISLEAADGGYQQVPVVQISAVNDSADIRVDSISELQNVIDKLINRGGGGIKLEPGIYRVAPEDNSAFVICKGSQITISGQGDDTVIVSTNPQASVFWLEESSEIMIRDLRIDYDPLPFTQGEIVEVNVQANTFDLKIDEGFDGLNNKWFLETNEAFCKWGMIFEPSGKHLKTDSPDHTFIESWNCVGDNVWRLKPQLKYQKNLDYMVKGDRFVQLARGIGIPAIMVNGCSACTVENVTVNASPCEAIVLTNCDDFTARNLRVKRPGNSNRLISTDSDGIHCKGNYAGPLIENCYFEGMADDTINIYSPPLTIESITSEKVVTINSANQLRKKDQLQVYDFINGRIYSEPTIVNIISSNDQKHLVELDRAVFGKGGLSKSFESIRVYNLSNSGRGYVIRNNLIEAHRRHGILLRTGNGIVESNTINAVAGLGIVVENAPGWPEGPLAENIVIKGNTIKHVGYSKGYCGPEKGGAITIQGLKLGGLAEGYVQRKILIEGNHIINPIGPAIYIGSAEDVTIKENVIERLATSRFENMKAFIVMENVSGLSIKNLRINDNNKGASMPIMINAGEKQNGVMVEECNIDVNPH